MKDGYRYVLQKTDSESNGKDINCYATKYELDNVEVVKIDSYFSWEFHCGKNYRKIIEKYINQDIDKALLEFKDYYLKLNTELEESLGE